MKNVAKLLIAAVLLLVILAITISLLQMTNRSRIKKTISDYEAALCKNDFAAAVACCAEDGFLIRNGKKIPFSDKARFFSAVAKRRFGTVTSIRYERIDVIGDRAEVEAGFLANHARAVETWYRINLERINGEWKITVMDDGSEVPPESEPMKTPGPAVVPPPEAQQPPPEPDTKGEKTE